MTAYSTERDPIATARRMHRRAFLRRVRSWALARVLDLLECGALALAILSLATWLDVLARAHR